MFDRKQLWMLMFPLAQVALAVQVSTFVRSQHRAHSHRIGCNSTKSFVVISLKHYMFVHALA